MTTARKRELSALVLILLLAAALRIIGIGRSPLRGDEAFAVRYWAAPPADILDADNGLAWREPHPFGTFFSFWAWKSTFGESEIMMRLLPALINLLGAAAMYQVGRRLFKDGWIGLAAAFLWAVNPFLIWHSQDARNYAMWAALSILAFAFLERATQPKRSRWAWIAYGIAALLALYTFFFEGLFILLHGIFVILFRREKLRTWIMCAAIIGVLIVPLFVQTGVLIRSGYQGTAGDIQSVNGNSIPSFYYTLAYGTTLGVNSIGIALFVLYLVMLFQIERRIGIYLTLYFLVPFMLLALISTRIAVFDPRYIIAAVPAALLPWAYLIGRVARGLTNKQVMEALNKMPNVVRQAVLALVVVLPGAFIVPIPASLLNYYSPDYRKAPDWYALRDYLRGNVQADDLIIVGAYDAFGTTDPALAYYYPGPADVMPLPYPGIDTASTIRRELTTRRAIWFAVGGIEAAQVSGALQQYGVLISDDFPVRQYRAKTVKTTNPSEIDTQLDLTLGGGTLSGYSLTGSRRSGGALTVMLFWATAPTQAGLKTFVHLVGADGQPIRQDDHAPAAGRDVYRLDLSGVAPGDYRLLIGLYRADSNERLPIRSAANGDQGTAYTLTKVTIGR